MSILAISVTHLGLLVVGLLGFIALAVATDRHGAQILGREPGSTLRRLARGAGWVLLAISLGWGVFVLGPGIGITLWLGWLSVAALALVFGIPRWSRQTSAYEHPVKLTPARARLELPIQRLGAHRFLAMTLLVAGVLGFSVLLVREGSRPTQRESAIYGKAGPWSFTLEEFDREAPEIMAMGVAMKTFRLRFCEECDKHIRQATLKVNRPHGPRATGMAFIGQRWDRKAEIPLPDTLRAESELWLTVVGKDGSIYQNAWRMDRVSPSTVAWFEQQRNSSNETP
ncbi:DUF3325 domain-containing protein [Ottowia thiooxydans]|uniref:DUF3325 domain-containing protein n=1 Tax=Ottowia thiooxydans TaxID=219182 RepID=A0ABV2Q6U6_9BURK